MVGFIPKVIYTQTNCAVLFLLLWIKQLYCNWTELTIYVPTTLSEFRNGCYDIFILHWPLLVFVMELLICMSIVGGIRRHAPIVTIQAISTEKVSLIDLGSIFTIIPVLALVLTNQMSLLMVLILVCLLVYEIYAFKAGCSNLTMIFLRYKEYKIVSTDHMSHRVLIRKRIRKGDDCYRVIEFNDIYLGI